MPPRGSWFLSLIGGLLLLCGGAPALAQNETDERAELARQIRETVQALQELREKRRQARQQHEAELDELNGQIARLEDDLPRVRQQLEQTREIITERETALKQAQQRRRRARSLIDTTARAARPAADELHQRLRQGVPHQRDERTGAIEQIQSNLAAESASKRAAAAGDLLDFLAGELESARTIELVNKPVLLNGGQRRVHAHLMRFGLAGTGFVSEAGDEVGLARVGAPESWLVEITEPTANALRAAVQRLRKRQPPAVAPVPLVIPASHGPANEPENAEGSQP